MSYASTGTALSDKTLYDLFARTVPSDMFQARAIADIVLKLNWSYVSLVSSEGLYGDSGSKEFMKQASVRRICIATHEKISPTTDDNAYDSIVANLLKRNATGVVLFTRAEDTRELLLAVKRAKLFHNFAWVAADGWGTHQKLVEGVEEVAWGAITVELQAKAIPGFDQYMKALTPWANGRNPWFSEYWQEWFDCQLQANLIQQQQVASGAFSRRNTAGALISANPGAEEDWSKSNNVEGPEYEESNMGSSNSRKRRRSLAECQRGGSNETDDGKSKATLAATCASYSTNETNLTQQQERQQQQQQQRRQVQEEERNQITSKANKGLLSAAKVQQLERHQQQQLASTSSSLSLSASPAPSPSSPPASASASASDLPRPEAQVGVKRVKRMANDLSANLKQFCSPNLRISESNGYRQEQKVQFVVDAVYAMAHALHKAWHNLCDAQYGTVCEALKELNGKFF